MIRQLREPAKTSDEPHRNLAEIAFAANIRFLFAIFWQCFRGVPPPHWRFSDHLLIAYLNSRD